MTAKEQFTDDVMKSLNGAGRAALDQRVREKILQGVRDGECTMYDVRCTMQDAGYGMQDEEGTMYDVRCTMYDAGYSKYSVKSGMLWKVAAAILLLISLNVFTMVHFSKSSSQRANAAKSIANEYFSFVDTINL